MSSYTVFPNYFEEELTYLKNFTQTLNYKDSPLHRAILEERLHLLETQLEDFSVDVNARNLNFETPVLAAVKIRNKELGLQFVERLVAVHADVNIPDYHGDSPLHEASKSDDGIVSALLQHLKCNVNAKNFLGETPLHVAKTFNAVVRLVEKGARIYERDNSDNVPLHRQVKNTRICAFLLENGASLNARNIHGFTPLHEAVFHNEEKTVELFIANDANVNAENNNTQRITPLQMAYRCHASAFIKKQLWRRAAPVYLLFPASYDNSTIPQVFQEWSSVKRDQQTLVAFILDLIALMKSSKDLKMVTCGRLVGRYFLSQIELVGDQVSRVLKKFSEYFGRTLLNFFLKTHEYNHDSLSVVEETVHILLGHGEVLDYSDLEVIYLQFGDCALLHELSKLPATPRTRRLHQLPLFLRAIWDVTMDLSSWKPISTIDTISFFNTHNFARYCTLPPKLHRHFLDTYHNIVRFERPELSSDTMEKTMKEIERTCGVPTLLEMSRNVARPVLARKYRVNKVFDLYRVLTNVGVPPLIVSLIIMEIPLHRNVKTPLYRPYTRHIYLL